MKIVSFEVVSATGRVRRLGAVFEAADGTRVADLSACHALYLARQTDEPTPRELAALRTPPDMIGWLRAGHEGLSAAQAALAFGRAHMDEPGLDDERLVYRSSEVRLLAPLPRPTSFRDFSIYEEHMSNVAPDPSQAGGNFDIRKPAWYKFPPYYKGNCDSIRGPEDPVPWPYYSTRLDLEMEIGIVIGRTGRNLTPAQALHHIAGYTLLIDSSARDGFVREPFGPTKRKDFHTALGPWLVTPDEAGDVESLACSVEVDGELWWQGSTAAPHSFRPQDLVAFASDNETLYPGDLLGTGTIGASCSMDTHRWIQVGQTATFTMERLGSLTLKVVAGERVVSHVLGMQGLLKHPSERS